MEEQKFSFSGSFKKIREYVDTQIDLVKLKTISRVSKIIGAIVIDASKVLLTLIIVFFLSMALGFYLGELMGSNALGFLTTGGIFFILLLLIKVFEPKLEAKFMDITIRKVLGKWNEGDDELEAMFKEDTNDDIKDKEAVDEDKYQ